MYFGEEIRSKLRVYNHTGDRCVCGASAVITGRDGYCMECSAKRDAFISDIIGYIDTEHLCQILGTHSSEITIIEKFRQLLLRRELLGLIDLHFATYNSRNNNFVEPYENPSFLGLIHEKKYEIMQVFFSELDTHTLEPTNLLIGIGVGNARKKLDLTFSKYQLVLKNQMDNDSINMRELINYTFSGQDKNQEKIMVLARQYRNKYNNCLGK